MAARIGVILSGCGVNDGSEITEAVSVLIALDKRGAQIICMAPDIPQTETINHLARKPEQHSRNVLAESARIARGKVRNMAEIHAADLDAIVFPGGFGAAKNLSSFAREGANCKVDPQVERLVKVMHSAGKPIGLACIAPVLAAKILGQSNHPLLTIGNDKSTAEAIGAMGAKHQDAGPTDICTDERNRIVTTPCYMYDSSPWQVYQGADKMVEEVLRLAK